jgi:hypothetical protein
MNNTQISAQQVEDFIKVLQPEQKQLFLSILEKNMDTKVEQQSEIENIEKLHTEYKLINVEIKEKKYSAIVGFKTGDDLKKEITKLNKIGIKNQAITIQVWDDEQTNIVEFFPYNYFINMEKVINNKKMGNMDYTGDYEHYLVFNFDDESEKVASNVCDFANNYDFECVINEAQEFINIQDEYCNLDEETEIIVFKNYNQFERIEKHVMEFKNDNGNSTIKMGILLNYNEE